jgi:hypothetical protein
MNQRLPRDWLARLSRLIGNDRARQWLGILARKRKAKFAALQASLARADGKENAVDNPEPGTEPNAAK